MLTKYIIYPLLLLSAFTAFSQIQTRPLKPGAITIIHLKKESAGLSTPVNIGTLTVLDTRDDTSNLGYSPDKATKQYVFKHGFITEITNWYYRYLEIPENTTNANTILINVRKLRLSDEAAPVIFENGKQGQPNNGFDKGVITKIDFYLKKDSFFIPLYRFDSILHFGGELKKYAAEDIATALKFSIEKLFSLDLDSIKLPRRQITLSDIERVNEQTHDIPILAGTNYKKGIYKTFRDFKLNVVDENDFIYKKGKMGDIIYVEKDGKEYPMQDLWGFCDGKDLYVKSANKYSKLIRTGNTFYFEGIKRLSVFVDPGGVSSMGGSYPTSRPNSVDYDINLNYYQLDMENGNIY